VTHYVLDTTTLIDFTHRREPVTTRIDAMLERGDQVYVCAVAIAELVTGFSAAELAKWWPFIRRFGYHATSREAAVQAGRDRHRLARQGRTIALTDALIAAAVRELGAILVTDNLRHFPMTDIEILSLRG
jgi:predicted nucleic acid-binding protein